MLFLVLCGYMQHWRQVPCTASGAAAVQRSLEKKETDLMEALMVWVSASLLCCSVRFVAKKMKGSDPCLNLHSYETVSLICEAFYGYISSWTSGACETVNSKVTDDICPLNLFRIKTYVIAYFCVFFISHKRKSYVFLNVSNACHHLPSGRTVTRRTLISQDCSGF